MLTVLTVSMIFGNYVNINDEACDSFAKIQVLCQNSQQKWTINEVKNVISGKFVGRNRTNSDFCRQREKCIPLNI